jgi:hypothetical protein
MAIESLVDIQLRGKEMTLGNVLNNINYVLSMVIKKNSYNMKKENYYMFAAIGVRIMSQYGAPSSSSMTLSNFGNSFNNLNWGFPSEYSKDTVLTLFLTSMQEDFNVNLL